jgi:hypothetical protein
MPQFIAADMEVYIERLRSIGRLNLLIPEVVVEEGEGTTTKDTDIKRASPIATCGCSRG